MRVGIMGLGGISRQVAKTLKRMPEIECYGAASRSLEKAEAFVREEGFEKAFGSYEEMVLDPKVELVYITTPIACHFENMKLCLTHKKHVLCEKAFTINAWEAKEAVRLAKENQVLLAEAIWTRYMPMREMLREELAKKPVGNMRMLTAAFGFPLSDQEHLKKNELGGGALLDLGMYAVNFAAMVFGLDIKEIRASAVLTPEGVDEQNSATLLYPDGKMAVLNSTMTGFTPSQGIIYGEEGLIVADGLNNIPEVRIYDKARQLIKTLKAPRQISGYEYEFLACAKAIEEGNLQCPQMPWEDSVRMMEVMDEIRRQCGIVYPADSLAANEMNS